MSKASDGLITANLDLPRILAGRLTRRMGLPHGNLLFEELRGSGFVGLVKASHAYDGRASTTFRTFAQYRINGAMLDYLRSIDTLSRNERRSGTVCDRELVTLDGLDLKRSVRATAEQVLASVQAHQLLDKLNTLDPRFAPITRMRFLEDLNLSEIGAIYHLTEHGVSQILKRALLNMRLF